MFYTQNLPCWGGDTTRRETFIGEAMRRLERSEQRGDGIFTPNPR